MIATPLGTLQVTELANPEKLSRSADAHEMEPPMLLIEPTGLLPVSQTPSLGVMMKPEVANGKEDVYSRVQA